MEKDSKQSGADEVNAWSLAGDILLDVNTLQQVQSVYNDDVLELTYTEKATEHNAHRRLMLSFVGEAIIKRMDEIQEELVALMKLIRSLQKTD